MTLPASIFQYLNIAIIVFVVLMLLYGYFKGFLLQIFSILLFIAITFVSWMIAPALAKAIPLMQANEQFNIIPIIGPLFQQSINTIFWFIIIVVGLMILSLFFKPVLKGIGKIPIIKTVNRILGLLLAGLKAAVVLVLLTLLLNSGLFTNGKALVSQSYLGQLMPITQSMVDGLSAKFDPTGLVGKIMTGSEFDADETIVLENWLSEKNVPDPIVPILSKLLRLKPISASEMTSLVEWMKANGISDEDIAKFMERFK
jgi:uncharacterized membrane protein required for colicin V production